MQNRAGSSFAGQMKAVRWICLEAIHYTWLQAVIGDVHLWRFATRELRTETLL